MSASTMKQFCKVVSITVDTKIEQTCHNGLYTSEPKNMLTFMLCSNCSIGADVISASACIGFATFAQINCIYCHILRSSRFRNSWHTPDCTSFGTLQIALVLSIAT